MIEVAIGHVLAFAVIDTGAGQTVMSVSMAQKLGLPVNLTNCRTYFVAGGPQQSYAGWVPSAVDIDLGEGVRFRVTGLHLIAHQMPLFLLGSDVLQGGRTERGAWNYAGKDRDTNSDGTTVGGLKFTCAGRLVKRPYYWVPSASAAPFSTRTLWPS